MVVRFQKLVAVSRSWWHPEAGGGGNATTTMAGLTFLIFCTWKHADYHMLLPPGWIFIFVFAARQQVPPLCKKTIKQASPGSCGGWFPEAGGGFQKLVASGGWWHLEAGGSRNATTTMAGLTVLIFCT